MPALGDVGPCVDGKTQDLRGLRIHPFGEELLTPLLQRAGQLHVIDVILGERRDIGCSVGQLQIRIGNAGEIDDLFAGQPPDRILCGLSGGVARRCAEGQIVNGDPDIIQIIQTLLPDKIRFLLPAEKLGILRLFPVIAAADGEPDQSNK